MATENAFESPDVVGDGRKKISLKGSITGVTRISKQAKMMVFGLGACLLAFILFAIYTVDSADSPGSVKAEGESAGQQDGPKGPEPARPGDLLKGVGDGQAVMVAGGPSTQGVGPGFVVPTGKDVPVVPSGDGVVVPPVVDGGVIKVPPPNGVSGVGNQPPVQSAPTPEKLAAMRLQDRRDQQRERALQAGVEFGGDGASGGGGSGLLGGADSPLAKLAGQLTAAASSAQGAGMPGLMNVGQPEADDLNKQVRKEKFLKDAQQGADATYLKETRRAALSPFEIKAGWAIPAILECGINSDLPGQTCARVRENVFDSAGRGLLLIPQGTKIVGTYDSRVAVGQERTLVVWSRLIFPDGSSFSLQGMPGADQAGNAGFEADVDNHYAKIFGGAIMMSFITAGVQLSQTQQAATGTSAPNTQQTIAGALGQQLGQASSAMIQRNMQIQPTLRTAPGTRFNIMITKDMIFPGVYGK
jgi:type IV secretion system protein TrbI